MKKVLSLIFVVTMLAGVFALNVSAETYVWNTAYRTITQIYPDTDFQFYLDGATIDTSSSCANRFVIQHTADNYALKVASLLTAYQNGDQILVKFDEDDTGCGTTVDMFKIKPE